MRWKEEGLLHWQSELSKKEYKLETGKENLSHLMSELRIKDSLLAEKDVIIGNREREMDDIRRDAQYSVTQQVEVC